MKQRELENEQWPKRDREILRRSSKRHWGLVLLALAAGSLRADSVSLSASTPVWGGQPACSQQSDQYGSVQCGVYDLAEWASATPNSVAATDGYGEIAGSASASASMSSTMSENLVVDGGSGSGTLTLYVAMDTDGWRQGYSDSAEATLTADSVTFGDRDGVCLRGPIDGCGWVDDRMVALTIPFTFGVPFLYTQSISLSAWVSGPNDAAWANGSITQTGFSVVDGDGLPVVGATLSDPPSVPEPETLVLVGVGLWGIIYTIGKRA